MEKHMELGEALHGKFVAWKNTWKNYEMTLFFCHIVPTGQPPSPFLTCSSDLKYEEGPSICSHL